MCLNVIVLTLNCFQLIKMEGKFVKKKMCWPWSSSSSGAFHLHLCLFLFLAMFPSGLFSLHCFECFDRKQPCTRFTNCSGSACVLYEHMPNRTSLAFCLLATAERQDTQMAQGCWRDAESGGLECVCTDDFCNAPRDLWTSDPNSAPIPGLKMLDKNPFVDYEYLDEEKAIQQDQQQSEGGKADLATALEDPELPAEGDEQDLMPKNFEQYLDWEQRALGRNLTPKQEEEARRKDDEGNNSSSRVPSTTPGTFTTDEPPAIVQQHHIHYDNTTMDSGVSNSRSFTAFWPLTIASLILLYSSASHSISSIVP